MNNLHPCHSYLLCAAELETHNVLTECPHFCVPRCSPLLAESGRTNSLCVWSVSVARATCPALCKSA